MKLKRRRKSGKLRGFRTHGRAGKKAKGSGNRGGVGMAGTGKKAGQKLSYIHKYFPGYFGKKGFTSKSTEKKKDNVINIGDIQNKYKPGEVLLENYKILGEGEIKDKFIIKAKSFSKQAKEKIEKTGGKAIELKKESKPEEHKENKK